MLNRDDCTNGIEILFLWRIVFSFDDSHQIRIKKESNKWRFLTSRYYGEDLFACGGQV